uniref:Testis expressed 49 n=1 Tax=Pelusios castaneus TaxID=367368 RepID=A0A8C8RE54_9SAUR
MFSGSQPVLRGRVYLIAPPYQALSCSGVASFFFSFQSGLKPLKGGLFHPKLPPIGPGRLDGTVQQGNYTSYREAIKQNRLKKSPNQVFRVPVTCAQESGWWLPKEPTLPVEEAIPWMTVQRHPLIRSPMTR